MSSLPPFLQSAFAWATWCFFHSFLISPGWIGRMQRLLGPRFACYRLLYNLFSLLTLLPLTLYHFSLKPGMFVAVPPWGKGAQGFLLLYALYMAWVGWSRYDLTYFLGVRQLADFRAGRSAAPAVFFADERGGVRHPWYSGGIALVWALGPLDDVSLAAKAVLGIYFVIGAFLEERKMRLRFGPRYEEYCRRVPMLLPKPWAGKVR